MMRFTMKNGVLTGKTNQQTQAVLKGALVGVQKRIYAKDGTLALRTDIRRTTASKVQSGDVRAREYMDNPGLNAQLRSLAEEKQGILEQMAALQEKVERQILQVSRRWELEKWLGQQPMMFTEYNDGVTRRLVERITVVDAETIRVKLRDTDAEVEQKLC